MPLQLYTVWDCRGRFVPEGKLTDKVITRESFELANKQRWVAADGAISTKMAEKTISSEGKSIIRECQHCKAMAAYQTAHDEYRYLGKSVFVFSCAQCHGVFSEVVHHKQETILAVNKPRSTSNTSLTPKREVNWANRRKVTASPAEIKRNLMRIHQDDLYTLYEINLEL